MNTPTTTPIRARITPLGTAVVSSQALLAGLFLFAASNKLIGANAPQLFSGSIQAFKTGLPDFAVRLSTGVVPWVEVVASLLLICGLWARAAAAVLSALLIFFIILIVQAIARDLDLHCGCFGKLSPFCPEKVGVCNIIQNSVLLVMGLLITFTPRHKLAAAN